MSIYYGSGTESCLLSKASLDEPKVGSPWETCHSIYFVLHREQDATVFKWNAWDADQIYAAKQGYRDFDNKNSIWGSNEWGQLIRVNGQLCGDYLARLQSIFDDPFHRDYRSWALAQAQKIAVAYQNDPYLSSLDQTKETTDLLSALSDWQTALATNLLEWRGKGLCTP